MKIFFVRHTEVDKIASDWIAGRTDVKLTSKGEAQANKLATSMAHQLSFDAIFSSPLTRCIHLANIFRNLTEKEYTIDERLAECDFGQWEGQRLNALYEQNPDLDLFSPPGGESIEQLGERVFSFWTDVILKLKAKNVLILAHGGTNSAFLMKLTNKPKENFWDLMQSYGGVNVIDLQPDGAIQVDCLNDVRYVNGDV